jgi:hypothetical protein
MGGISTQEEIVARLDELDKEEININKQLRELQIELNGIVPVRDRVKVKSEYFDNVSIGELGKHQENQDINDNKEEIIKESSDKSSEQPKKKKEKLKTDGNAKKKLKKSGKKKK